MVTGMSASSLRTTFRHPITTGLVLVSTAGLLAGCTSSAAQLDVSDDGRLAFACSLADHVDQEHDAPTSRSELIGDDADPSVREIATLGNLLVAAEDPLSVTAQNLLMSVSRTDTDEMVTRLDEVRAGCEDLDVNQTADVSHESQLDYACALVDHVEAEYGPASQWPDMYDTPAVYLVAAAASATGAYNGQVLEDEPQLSDAGLTLYQSVSRMDAELTDEALVEFQSVCQDR